MRYSSPPSYLVVYSNFSMSNTRGRSLWRRGYSGGRSSDSKERGFVNRSQTSGYRQDPGFSGTQPPPPHFRPRSSSAYGFRPPHPRPVHTSQQPHSHHSHHPQPEISHFVHRPPLQFHLPSQNSHFANHPPLQFHVPSQNPHFVNHPPPHNSNIGYRPPPQFHVPSQNSHFVNRPPLQFQVPPPQKLDTAHRPPLQFHPSPHHSHFHPPPSSSGPSFHRPRPDDYRIWVPSKSQPSPHCEHFRLVTYNILADYLARDHQLQLYFHVPSHVLDWEWRKRKILIELQLWSPDILCLQEVDKFQDLENDLSLRGYHGIWKMRTGTATDGCAIFWRTNRFQMRHKEHIEFNKLGLRDNVAQICVLESRAQRHVDLKSADSSESHNKLQEHNQIVVCNIHVLYNPKRGEIKLGQVRVLLDQAYSVSRQWNNAPVILCGDFNCTPKSPLYNFLSDQTLNLSGLDRDQISGQNSACIQEPKHYPSYSLHRIGPRQLSNDLKRGVGDYAETLHKRLDNISPRYKKESAEVSVSLKMDIHQEVKHNDQHIESNSGDYREIQLLKHHIKDHDEINTIPRSSESNGNHQHVGKLITCQQDPSFHSVVSMNQSVGNDTDAGLLCSSMESLLGQPSGTKLYKSDKEVYSCQEEFSDEMKKGKTSSYNIMASLKANTENVSSAIVSEKCSEKYPVEVLIETADEDILSSDLKDKLPNSFLNLDSCVDSTLVQESASLSATVTNKPNDKGSEENPINSVCFAELNKPYSEDANDSSAEKSSVILELDLSESVHQESEIHRDSWQENPDPNFLAELHGSEDMFRSTSTEENQIIDSNFHYHTSFHPSNSGFQTRNTYNPYAFTPMEIEVASGNADCSFLQHNLKLKSVYTEVKDCGGTRDSSGEPQVTSYNRKFMGTVDYIWFSEGVQTAKVLDTIRRDVLQRTPGFPTLKWGSDHLALGCELAFT